MIKMAYLHKSFIIFFVCAMIIPFIILSTFLIKAQTPSTLWSKTYLPGEGCASYRRWICNSGYEWQKVPASQN
ncbi:MAG: hypothetical protein QXG58_01245 [Candidatus Bathyarchaeia archaeon]